MSLKDHYKESVDFVGIFSIKSLDKDGNVIDEYTDKNLIMDEARRNMAQLVGGVSSTSTDSDGLFINKFVLGTLGHNGTNVLDNIKVGTSGFVSSRTALFSELVAEALNYRVSFSPSGGLVVTDSSATGTKYYGGSIGSTDTAKNTVVRTVSDRTVTYQITIPTTNANSDDSLNPVVAYTEAALYAGGELFSMKTFPARVKESTVEFVITWSIIF